VKIQGVAMTQPFTLRVFFFAAFTVWGSSAFANFSQCVAGLKPNELSISNDYAAQWHYLQSLDESSYKVGLQSGQVAAILGPIPLSASYSEFSERRNNYVSRYEFSGTITATEDYFHLIYTPDGYKAYAECIRAASQQPFKMWVSGRSGESIVIDVEVDLPHEVTGTVEVTGPNNQKENINFTGDTLRQVKFVVNPAEDFLVNAQVVTASGEGVGTATLTFPRQRHFEKREITRPVTAHAKCQAGCHGKYHGCQTVINVEMVPSTINATFADDYHMQTLSNNGIRSINYKWKASKRRITTEMVCKADSKHTQKTIKLMAVVTEVEEKIIEDELTAKVMEDDPELAVE
jgi:hypothetical protein